MKSGVEGIKVRLYQVSQALSIGHWGEKEGNRILRGTVDNDAEKNAWVGIKDEVDLL